MDLICMINVIIDGMQNHLRKESVQKFHVHSELRLCPLGSLKYEF